MNKFIILEIVFFTLATYSLFHSDRNNLCSSLFFVFVILMFVTGFYNIDKAMIIGEKIMQTLELIIRLGE